MTAFPAFFASLHKIFSYLLRRNFDRFIGVPSNMGVVAVYALNDEFKSILRESKNGMVSSLSYVLAKTVLVLPIFFVFGLFAHGIPLFVVQGAPGASFPIDLILYAVVMFVYESVAECLSVWFEDPILGMLQFMNFWVSELVHKLQRQFGEMTHTGSSSSYPQFGGFLFGGFLIPLKDLYYPFEIFYHIMPFSYYIRSAVFNQFKHSTFEACNVEENPFFPVCVDSTEGLDVLDGLGRVLPLFSSKDETSTDFLVLIGIGLFYKAVYIAGVVYKTSQTSKFQN
jgi:hypothetical protein